MRFEGEKMSKNRANIKDDRIERQNIYEAASSSSKEIMTISHY